MEKEKSKYPPLFVELPDDLREWLEASRRKDGHTIKEKTIRVFKQARLMEEVAS